MRFENESACDELIGERTQSASGDERRIEIAQRAGGGVTRILEQRLARPLALGIDFVEGLSRQVDFAANLDSARRRLPRETQRYRPDRPHVRRDVLTAYASAA